MKKLLPILVLVVVAGAAWYFSTAGASSTASTALSTRSNSQTHSGAESGAAPAAVGGATQNRAADGFAEGTEFDDDSEEDLRPATAIYRSAEEALQAVRRAAADYDDLVLEQFTEPGPDCSWCPQFYREVKDMMFAADTPSDQRSYYAELLAISGRPDNVAALLQGVKGAPTQDEKDIYAEALELTLGGDDVVRYLAEQMNSEENAPLMESLVAAVTNQGSRLAAETLYQQTITAGDPDGYYSQGIGLGEFVPGDDAMPFLQEQMMKRDQYSHLAVKSLLNGGLNGVRIVLDVLSNSSDYDNDRKLLRDAVDHVSYEEDVEQYLKRISETSRHPVVTEFAKQVLADFESMESEFDTDDDEDANDLSPEELEADAALEG